MGFLDYLSSSAVSLTVSGNTGISPFLTLLLLGIIEKSDPELLNMDGFIEKMLSSWVGLGVLSVLTGYDGIIIWIFLVLLIAINKTYPLYVCILC
jgi:hypothetical protein